MIRLLPGWEHLAGAPGTARAPGAEAVDLPRIVRVAGAAQIAGFLDLLRAGRITAIGIRVASLHRRPTVALRSGDTWADVRSLQPTYVALTGSLGDESGAEHRQVVIDLQAPGGVPAVATAAATHIPLITHDAKPLLFALWGLGLEAPVSLFDTAIAAGCLHLGRYHRRALPRDVGRDIRAEQDIQDEQDHLLSLQGQCAHYRLGFPYSGTAPTEPRDRVNSIAATLRRTLCDAEWALRLYRAQLGDIAAADLHHHLQTVEFPFAIANARIEWVGVPVSAERMHQLAAGAKRAADHYATVLHRYGVNPAGSRHRFLDAMQRLGLSRRLTRYGAISTEDNALEPIEHLHPAIRAFRLHARYRRLAGEEWLTGITLGADGRLHPRHTQLGAATGRNSCSCPNLAGIGRVMRPVITAPPGRALVELDYAQIEVGVAAAHHDDPDLVAAFNSGDVYAAMAQHFYGDWLAEGERKLSPAEFKKQRPDLRDRIKTFVLAVLYNIQPWSIAVRFGIPVEQARIERERFLVLYPKLRAGLEADSQIGAARGYATMVTGLRRHIPAHAAGTQWAINFLRNTPIQGNAAIVFKRAVVMLDREFAGTSTWIVLPVHDAVLIECDIENVDSVCARATDLMRHAFRHYYPQLQPRIDVNRVDVTCWNKNGHGDSLDRFLADAEASVSDWPPRLRLCAPPAADPPAGEQPIPLPANAQPTLLAPHRQHHLEGNAS